MGYYTIQQETLLIADSSDALSRFYNNVRELPEDYKPNYYIVVDGELVLNPDYEEQEAEKERARIMELKMTPLDFLKAIEQYGITYDMVKQFMEQNPLIERELRFCQNVYRKHPMLNELATYGITSEILDTIFKKANGVV